MSDIFERFDSANITVTNKDATTVSRFVCKGPQTQGQALYDLALSTPLFYLVGANRLVRQQLVVSPLGPAIWQAEVTYGPDDDPRSEPAKEAGDYDFAFDTTGATAKKQLSERTVSSHWLWSMSNMPPNLGKVIGAQGGKVEGVDVIVPKLEFSVTAFYTAGRVTIDWVKGLARATGKVNSDAWLGFAPGELLFTGARGSGPIDTLVGPQRKPVSITLQFAASENRDDIVIGTGNPAPIAKKGWEYLWVRYERVRESGLEYPIPVHAYVEEVYPAGAFTPFFGFG
jgi:hypothetical protein